MSLYLILTLPLIPSLPISIVSSFDPPGTFKLSPLSLKCSIGPSSSFTIEVNERETLVHRTSRHVQHVVRGKFTSCIHSMLELLSVNIAVVVVAVDFCSSMFSCQ